MREMPSPRQERNVFGGARDSWIAVSLAISLVRVVSASPYGHGGELQPPYSISRHPRQWRDIACGDRAK